MKCEGKACGDHAHYKEAPEIDFVEVFGIEKQVGNAQILAKVARYHGEQNDPTNHHRLVAPQVVEEQLNGE